jgi:hypothetical protein
MNQDFIVSRGRYVFVLYIQIVSGTSLVSYPIGTTGSFSGDKVAGVYR